MSGNAKFRWFLLAPIVVALFVVSSPVVSWAGELWDAKEKVRQNPNDGLCTRHFGIYVNRKLFNCL